jgi:hypothetical protein
MTVPSGALPSNTTITIEEIAAPVGGALGKTYEIGPTGTQFVEPVTLSFKYTAADLAGADPSDLEVATVVDGAWVGLTGGSVDATAQLVTGQTTHLSPYGIHAKGRGNGVDGGNASSSGTTSSGSTGSSSGNTSSGSTGNSPMDAGFDAAGCMQSFSQVGTCINHQQGLCPGNTYFTNCTQQMPQGISWYCCPGG